MESHSPSRPRRHGLVAARVRILGLILLAACLSEGGDGREGTGAGMRRAHARWSGRRSTPPTRSSEVRRPAQPFFRIRIRVRVRSKALAKALLSASP